MKNKQTVPNKNRHNGIRNALQMLWAGFLFTAALSQPVAGQTHRHAHGHISGRVLGLEYHAGHQDTIPLFGAEVFWINSALGTTTDSLGRFHLAKPDRPPYHLVVRYVAYQNDTLHIHPGTENMEIVLQALRTTSGLAVEADRAHIRHHLEPVHGTQTISESGLRTLACCTLSESFENTASVDVEHTDVISGARRIKMLGLAGSYTQILIEKTSVMRGFVSPFALEYIPGPWMESIDISKGTASVMTGYESMTGQINVELKKPEREKPFSLNLYRNSLNRTEGSLSLSYSLNDRLSTGIWVYGNRHRTRMDRNSDTFLDMPLTSHVNVMNRWSYETPGRHVQLGFRIIDDRRDGGQVGFDFANRHRAEHLYGFHNRIRRKEAFFKAGAALDGGNTGSIGLIVSAFNHGQESFWGMKSYSNDETGLYFSLNYQKRVGRHGLSAGAALNRDDRTELYNQTAFSRDEFVPGLFAEYTWQIENQWTAVMGFRYDRHNRYGDLYTPRMHLKYHFGPESVFRMTFGKGYRSPNILSENTAVLASSRTIHFLEKPDIEEAWNVGFQYVKCFRIGADKPATFMADFYRTDFRNQVIVDLEEDPLLIHIYNLKGRSFSNAAQVEFMATIFRGFEVSAAWRFHDVRATFHGGLRDVPLNIRHKGLLVFSYTTPARRWQFDLTTQLNGKSRLPDTSLNPREYRMNASSPAYAMLLGQIKRLFGDWEIYAGMENITDFRQKYPILAWQEPFGPYFDSSHIWGPTVGRRIYAGIRIH
ncbi:MAG TPA: TonB-dependent receptor [bacterium]|nr:TonB-dependent receptor [bacterium]